MTFVVDVCAKGRQEFKDTTGRTVSFNTAHLFCVTDEVPESYQDGNTFFCVTDLKINPEKIRCVGFEDFHELCGKYVEVGITIAGGKPTINKITVLKNVGKEDLAPLPKEVKNLTPIA